ncbi:hypothetical protein Tco_1524340 [Tanacetum coccineum]
MGLGCGVDRWLGERKRREKLLLFKLRENEDGYSRILSEKHVENEENAEIDENGNKTPPDDFDVQKGVATSNKGLVLGAGSTKDPSFVLTGVLGSGSIYAEHTCSPYEGIQILKKQKDDMTKKMKEERDVYSRILSKKHVENKENAEIDENGNKSPPDDFDVQKGVATSNKGLVLGAGSTKDPSFVLTGVLGSESIYAEHTCSPYEGIQILKKQNDDLTKKMKEERVVAKAQREADLLEWQKRLNDRFESFAQNYSP